MIHTVIHRRYLKTGQVVSILIAVLFPWLANISYITNIFPLAGIDPTPFAFSITGILLSLSVFGYRIFDITPVAHNQLISTMQDAVIVLNTRQEIIDLNPAAHQLFGSEIHRAGALFGRFPDLANQINKTSSGTLSTKEITDTTGKWYAIQLTPLRNVDQELEGWLIVFHDITNQKAVEETAARLAAVIEQAQETIVITDLDGNIEYTNPYFEKTTGYTFSEALGQNPRILKAGLQDKHFYTSLWNTIITGDTWSGTFINKRKDGSLYHETATIFPIKDPDGTVTHYAAVKRDITRQVEAEAAINDFSAKLTGLHQVNLELSMIDAFDDMCKRAIELGIQLLGFDRLGLWFVDQEDPTHFRGSFGVDDKGQICDERSSRIRIGDRELHTIIQTQKPQSYYLGDTVLRNAGDQIVGQGSLAAAGLWGGAQFLGLIFTDNLVSQQPLTDRQCSLLSLYAQILGNLTARKRDEVNIKIFAHRQFLLNNITRAAIEKEDLQEMLQILADRMGELFNADGCYITLWHEDTQTVTAGAAYGTMRTLYRSQINQPRPGEPTLTTSVLTAGKPLAVADVMNSPYISPRLASQFPAVSQLALPLIANNQKLGAALIGFNQPHSFTADEINLGEQAAQQLALAILKAKLLEEARRLSLTDSMTGILNHRYLIETAQQMFHVARRYSQPLCFLMFDIDHFKVVNDTYGHLIGDQVLQTIARTCEQQLRQSDVIGRYGGEEFVILLPETGASVPEKIEVDGDMPDPGEIVAQRIRQAIEQLNINYKGISVKITISIGIASLDGTCPDAETLIDRADQAMYQAKRNGRNNVAIWGGPTADRIVE